MRTSLIILVVVTALGWPAATRANGSVALVIGNGRYEHVDALTNPTNDAADMVAALTRLGFDVQQESELGYDAMRRVLRDFGNKASGADMAVVYFAGHGIEIDRQNYLVPVDARLENDRDVQFEALPLDSVLLAVEGARKLRLVLLDACRNNPFAAKIRRSGSTRSIGRGLARVEPGAGTLVAFAAKEGTVARDGNDRNSPYTTALLEHLAVPGLEINFLFRKVRDSVLAATGNAQEPFVYGSLPGEALYLNPPTGGQGAGTEAADPSGPPADVQSLSNQVTSLQQALQDLSRQSGASTPPAPAGDGNAARQAWEAIGASDSPAVFRAYIRRFPDSLYTDFARARLDELEREEESRRQAARPSEPPAGQDGESAPKGGWFVILGSFPKSQRWKADDRAARVSQSGLPAQVIDTDRYQNLRDGLFAVVLGPYSRGDATTVMQQRARPVIGDAYIKEAY